MAHFIIQFPDGRKAAVRKGTITKKAIGLQGFFKKKLQAEKRIGYIIYAESPGEQRKEYRLLKSAEGSWLREEIAGFGYTVEDDTCIHIKKAIDEYERSGIPAQPPMKS